MNVKEAYVSFAAFDAADIRSVEVAGERQGFLGESLFLSELPHTLAEALLNLFFR